MRPVMPTERAARLDPDAQSAVRASAARARPGRAPDRNPAYEVRMPGSARMRRDA